MVGLITNENALIAQAVFRAANADVADVQQTISTGLLVEEAADNPAFFLVAQQTTGDQVVVDAIADNLEIAFQAAATAEAAIDNVFGSLDRITDSITLADSGIALQELNFAISQEVEFIRNIIGSTSFNGLNLLSGSQTFTALSGVVREGGEIRFQSLQLTGLNLDDLSLFGESGAIGGQSLLGVNERDRAQTQGEALIRSFRPELAEVLDLNQDGFVEIAPDSPDDAVQGDGGSFTLNVDRDTFEALPFLVVSNEQSTFIPSFFASFSSTTGPVLGTFLAEADPEFLARADTFGDGAFNALDDLDGSPFDASFTFRGNLEDFQFFSSFNVEAEFNGSEITVPGLFGDNFITAPFDNQTGNQQTNAEVIENSILSANQLREFASGSGFSGLLNLLDVSNPLNSTAGALVVVDVLREKANLAASQLGTISQAISNQQEFLSALSDSLSIGVAALVEADLDEESGRVQAALVRQALAVQGLAVANAQPGQLLQLFESA